MEHGPIIIQLKGKTSQPVFNYTDCTNLALQIQIMIINGRHSDRKVQFVDGKSAAVEAHHSTRWRTLSTLNYSSKHEVFVAGAGADA